MGIYKKKSIPQDSFGICLVLVVQLLRKRAVATFLLDNPSQLLVLYIPTNSPTYIESSCDAH